MSFQNVYHHRKVADTASKPCEICYKPSTSVLVTPDTKDFFYVCPAHLKDQKFCSPIIDQAAVADRKKQELEAEKERLKQEYEEKQKKKKDKEKEKDKKEDEKKDGKEKDDAKDEKNKVDVKLDAPNEQEPRIFALQSAFYQMRVNKKKVVEQAKRNRERLQNPNLFPAVPKDLP